MSCPECGCEDICDEDPECNMCNECGHCWEAEEEGANTTAEASRYAGYAVGQVLDAEAVPKKVTLAHSLTHSLAVWHPQRDRPRLSLTRFVECFTLAAVPPSLTCVPLRCEICLRLPLPCERCPCLPPPHPREVYFPEIRCLAASEPLPLPRPCRPCEIYLYSPLPPVRRASLISLVSPYMSRCLCTTACVSMSMSRRL